MHHLKVEVPHGLSPHDTARLVDALEAAAYSSIRVRTKVTICAYEPMHLSTTDRAVILHALALIPEAQTALSKVMPDEPRILTDADLKLVRALRERLDA